MHVPAFSLSSSSELVLTSPTLLRSHQRQKRCVPPTSPAWNQCLRRVESRLGSADLGSSGGGCPPQSCWDWAGRSRLLQKTAGASDISLRVPERQGGGKAQAWLRAERLSHSVAWTWPAGSGTTPGRGKRSCSRLESLTLRHRSRVPIQYALLPCCEPPFSPSIWANRWPGVQSPWLSLHALAFPAAKWGTRLPLPGHHIGIPAGKSRVAETEALNI